MFPRFVAVSSKGRRLLLSAWYPCEGTWVFQGTVMPMSQHHHLSPAFATYIYASLLGDIAIIHEFRLFVPLNFIPFLLLHSTGLFSSSKTTCKSFFIFWWKLLHVYIATNSLVYYFLLLFIVRNAKWSPRLIFEDLQEFSPCSMRRPLLRQSTGISLSLFAPHLTVSSHQVLSSPS